MSDNQIHIDGARAVELLRAVVAEHGANTAYVFRWPQDQDHPPPHCRYTYDGCPDCLIGRALALAGVTVGELADMDADPGRTGIGSVMLPARLHLTEQGRNVFKAAQLVQDDGATWGEALAAAEAVIA